MEVWTIAGFAIVVISGLLIFSSDPNKYIHNGAFQLKMALLLAGILYNYTLHRVAVRSDPSGLASLAGGFSLLLWAAVAWVETPVETVVRQFRLWKWAGFLLIVTCGSLLASAKAATYYPNPYFRIKILLLALVGVHAFVFRRGVYDGGPGKGFGKRRLAAYLSLALWLGILSMGRWIAYYDPPKGPGNQVANAVPVAPQK